jgi:hypothetical protein
MKYDLIYPDFLLTLLMIRPVRFAAQREMAGWHIRHLAYDEHPTGALLSTDIKK